MAILSQTTRTFFTDHNCATTPGFFYNESGGTGASDGWVRVQGDHVVVQTCVATKIRYGNVVYRIEGKFDGLDRAASIKTGIVAAAQPIDELYVVDPKIKELRVGVSVSDNGATNLVASPTSFYAGVCVTEVK